VNSSPQLMLQNHPALSSIVSSFCNLLENSSRDRACKPDEVKSLFQQAILNQSIALDNIDLNQDTPCFFKRSKSIWIPPSKSTKGIAVYFRFNHRYPNGSSLNVTQQAGIALNHLNRLSQVEHNMHRLFVYLTDDLMVNYFNNREALSILFRANEGQKITIDPNDIAGLARSLRHEAGLRSVIRFTLFQKRNLPRDEHLRIWEIA